MLAVISTAGKLHLKIVSTIKDTTKVSINLEGRTYLRQKIQEINKDYTLCHI